MNETRKTTKPETEPNGSATGPAYRKGIEAVRLAHAAETQSMIAEQSRHNEELRQAVNGEAVSIPGRKGEDVGTSLSIDSPTTVNHYHGKPADGEPKKKAGRLARLALGAGLIASGAGTYAGGSIVLDVLRERLLDTSQVEQERPTVAPVRDPSRAYSLDLGD